MNPNEEMDDTFWADVANAPPPPDGDSMEPLPAGLFYVGATATAADNNWKPELRSFNSKKVEGAKVYTVNVGLRVVGGEAKVPVTLAKRWQGWDAFVLPSERDPNAEKTMLGGKVNGFLNAVFATGVAADIKDKKDKAAERWAVTYGKIKAAAGNYPDLVPARFVSLMPNKAWGQGLYLAAVAMAMLCDEGHLVIFKTYVSKGKDGRADKTQGDVEEYTMDSAGKRKVRLFDASGEPVAEVAPAF